MEWAANLWCSICPQDCNCFVGNVLVQKHWLDCTVDDPNVWMVLGLVLDPGSLMEATKLNRPAQVALLQDAAASANVYAGMAAKPST
jgi:hypothetical protein